MTYFLVIGISVFILLSIFGYFIARKKERERERERETGEKKEANKKTSSSTFYFRWTTSHQAMIIVMLLAALVIVLFLAPIKNALSTYPLVITGMIIAMVMLFIGGNPEKTITKVRSIALIALVGSFLMFVIWPAYIGPHMKLILDLPAKTKEAKGPAASIRLPLKKSAENLNSTGIVLQPGEKIVGTKNPNDPPVDLIISFSDGERIRIRAKHWTERRIGFTNIGRKINGRSSKVFYTGEAGKYHFERASTAKKINATPAIYSPPPGKQSANCPFEEADQMAFETK